MTKAIRKEYHNSRTGETTKSATTALQWHKAGDGVQITAFRGRRTVKHAYLHGATVETYREKSDRENRDICRRYAEELEQYADGMAHRCPHCGTENIIPGYAPAYCCEHCHTQTERDAWEQLTLYDYLIDCYDIEYRIGGDREYRSAEICLAWGGPNIYIDTARDAINLYWGGERETYYISGSLSDQIDDICEEQYNNI